MLFQIKSLKDRKNKRGVSIMVGYVLLVSFAVIIGVITYGWIKTYAPTESIECSDGTSLSITNTQFDPITNNLSVTIKNNGRFNTEGYFIRVKNDSNQSIDNIDIAENIVSGENRRGSKILKTLGPNDNVTLIFYLPDIGTPRSVTIIPSQEKVFGNRERSVTCGDAQVRQNVNIMELLYVFLEDSGGYDGNFGGLDAADTICNNTGNSPNEVENGTYVAWLSTNDEAAKDRIQKGIYVLPGDSLTLVANNRSDLLDGSIENPININSKGKVVTTSGGVWTGTNEQGTTTGINCENWTSNSTSVNGTRGKTSSTSEWTESTGDPEECSDGSRGIYCFQIS